MYLQANNKIEVEKLCDDVANIHYISLPPEVTQNACKILDTNNDQDVIKVRFDDIKNTDDCFSNE